MDNLDDMDKIPRNIQPTTKIESWKSRKSE